MDADLLAMMNAPPLTPAERRRAQRRSASAPQGYAWKPGTGPEGETCKTCAHCTRLIMSKPFHKCGKARSHWTGSRRTDILVGSPACKFWETDHGQD